MRIYVRLLIVAFCFVVSGQTPETSETVAVPPPETTQKSATFAAKKQMLATLLSSADGLRQSKDTHQAVLTLNEAGHLQLDLNLTDEALVTFQRSQALLDQGIDSVTTVDTLNGLASVYVDLGKCADAQPLLAEAGTKSDQINYPEGKAEALLLLSQCQNYNNHALAFNTAAEALSLWQSVGNTRGAVRSHLQIGQFQLAQTMLADATESFQTALEKARTLGDAKLQAESLIYLGFIEFRKGAWQELFAFSADAERLIDADAEPFLMGLIISSYADALIETGLADVGLEKFRQALEYFRRANRPDAFPGTIWGVGKAHYFLGQYPEALADFRQALADAESKKQTTWIAQTHEYLGRTLAGMNEDSQALAEFESALTVYIQMGNPMEMARVRALMGQVYQAQGKLDKAGDLYKEALKTFDGLNDHVNRSATFFGLGKLEMQRRNYDAAEVYFKQSVEITENVRRMSTSRDLTAAFSATVHDRYEQYIECLMHRNDKEAVVRAFELSESSRARSLVEFLRGTETNLLANLDPELAKREKTLRQLMRSKEDERMALLTTEYKKADLESLDTKLAKLEEEYKSVTMAISRRYPAYDQITQPRSWDLGRIQERVISDDDTILLEYLIGANKSYVWAVTRSSFTGHEISGDIDKAAEAVYKLLKESKTDNENELTQATQTLAQMILAPVADQLNKRRIVVIADGVLHYIPFQILSSGSSNNEPLVAQHEIINAPSASILGELREQAAGREARSKLLAAFGDPVIARHQDDKHKPGDTVAETQRDIELSGEKFDPVVAGELFYAEREINNLRDIASPDKTFAATGYAANRNQLFSMDLSQFAILHFATHGFLDPKHPEHSGLLLSMQDEQGKDQKGFIELQDVYSLRAPVDLVVMSACQTALGREVRGEGLVGLTRGFMYAGATTVVASLWKVDDEATAELMKRFYIEMLQNQKTPDEALRIAQNYIRQIPRWHAPHYWAGFILQGEYRYVVNSERSWRRYSTLIVIGIVAVLLVSAAGWYRYRGAAVSSAMKK